MLPAELKEIQALDIVIIDFSVSVAKEFYLFFLMLEFLEYESINYLSKLFFFLLEDMPDFMQDSQNF